MLLLQGDAGSLSCLGLHAVATLCSSFCALQRHAGLFGSAFERQSFQPALPPFLRRYAVVVDFYVVLTGLDLDDVVVRVSGMGYTQSGSATAPPFVRSGVMHMRVWAVWCMMDD